MVRKWMVCAIACCMLCGGTAYASGIQTEDEADLGVEAVSSASVTDFYGDYAISGDELMDAVNGPSGSYVISTVNEDGTPLAGFFVYSMLKDGEDYYLQLGLAENQTRANLDIDAEISFVEINHKFFNDLKRMRPFGPDNPKPTFCTCQVYDYGTSKVVGREQEHIKLELVDTHSSHIMNGIAFGQSSQARYIKTKHAFDIAYTIEDNTHKKGEIQLQIVDIRTKEQEGQKGE